MTEPVHEPVPEPSDPLPFWPVYSLGLPLVDLSKALALADELDDLAALHKNHET
jgi:hypothetical protein